MKGPVQPTCSRLPPGAPFCGSSAGTGAGVISSATAADAAAPTAMALIPLGRSCCAGLLAKLGSELGPLLDVLVADAEAGRVDRSTDAADDADTLIQLDAALRGCVNAGKVLRCCRNEDCMHEFALRNASFDAGQRVQSIVWGLFICFSLRKQFTGRKWAVQTVHFVEDYIIIPSGFPRLTGF